jgi:hypothetical protein
MTEKASLRGRRGSGSARRVNDVRLFLYVRKVNVHLCAFASSFVPLCGSG